MTVGDQGDTTIEANPTNGRAPKSSALSVAALFALIGIAIARIVSTYHVFNDTIDEGAHIACGMQWFESVYDYEPMHTPIARIAVALLPYLDGVRSHNDPSFWREGLLLLSSGGHYWHNLTLARMGTLPFFVLATVILYIWARRLYGVSTALLAAGIFTLQPMILAHSGLATTDIALTAMFLLAAYAFLRWLSNPSWRTALCFGVATALSIATKLSTLAFLPAVIVGVVPLYLAGRRTAVAGSGTGTAIAAASGEARIDSQNWRLKPLLGHAVVVILSATLILWACYRFSHAPVSQFTLAPDRFADRVFGLGSFAARDVHKLTATLQLPAPELYNGLRDLRELNRKPVPSYLLGQVNRGGWWYFYPVAIVFKTPLAVLLLALLGGISLVSRWLRDKTLWQQPIPLVSVLAMLAVVAPSRLDIGVRHVMPVFAFLSMLAAVGAVRLWNWSGAVTAAGERSQALRKAGPVATAGLLAWLVGVSISAHPDYLAYFNELAGRNPANILVTSDLDWGQDLSRLANYLRQQRAEHVYIAYSDIFDPSALDLPDSTELRCGETPVGWVAVGEDQARLHPDCYPWLPSQSLRAYVGKSLRVFYLPESVPTVSERTPGS